MWHCNCSNDDAISDYVIAKGTRTKILVDRYTGDALGVDLDIETRIEAEGDEEPICPDCCEKCQWWED